MKKKILAAVLSVIIVGGALVWAIPALAQTTGPLDHVVISPAGAILNAGAVQQFTAQALDSNNQTAANVSYLWLVTSGGGAINSSTGVFTAGSTPGAYPNTVEVVAVQGKLAKVAAASITVTQIPFSNFHVMVTPASAAVQAGGSQQFTAQAYDNLNNPVAGLGYIWSVPAGGGVINSNGVFTAGATAGTFTVQVMATTPVSPTVGTATITVGTVTGALQSVSPSADVSRMIKAFGSFVKGNAFANFLGGEARVKNGTGVSTIDVIPGIVQSATSATLPISFTITPNDLTAARSFTVSSASLIRPSGAILVAGDKVVVITVDGQVSAVLKINLTSSITTPPGQHGKDNRDGKQAPPGWSHGKKTGWQDNEIRGRQEDDNDD